MPDLWKISNVKDILSRHGFTFSKALGQNFLINPTVCPRMAACCGADQNTGVIEVGPGMGVLTRELSAVAKKVVAVELDERLRPVLQETLGDLNNVKIVWGDVLQLNLNQLIQQEFAGMKVVLCANLPYYITSQVVMKLLRERLPVESITVMVQKEAAQRLCAPIGSRDSGAVTVAVHTYCAPKIQFFVSKGSFMPAPKIDSAVITLERLPEARVDLKQESNYFRVVSGAFANRRKTAINSLAISLHCNKDMLQGDFAQLGIPEGIRAENLSIDQFLALSQVILP